MAKMYIMVGIPASGKSTLARERANKENAIYLSSDSIRFEIFGDENIQENNNLVFETMNKRASQSLRDGIDVYYDAMNLSRKRRKGLMRQMPRNTEFVAIYLHSNYHESTYRNNKRKRSVPQHVIEKSYKSLEIPVLGEGFSNIEIVGVESTQDYKEYSSEFFKLLQGLKEESHDKLFFVLGKMLGIFNDMYNMPQDSTYHPFSISRHTYHVYKAMKETEYKNDINMLVASLLHDSGKPFCKTFYNYKGDLKRYASFYNHERVSSQVVYDFWEVVPYFDKNLVSTLCQFHMKLHDPNCKRDELIKLVGQDTYDMLVVLNECDKKGK